MEERYARDAEAFVTGLTREEYLTGAGLKEQLEIAPLYDKYGWLFTREAVRDLLAHRGDRQSLHLAEFGADNYLENRVKALTEQITNATLKATVEWDGQPVSYRSASVVLNNEPDPGRRHDLFRRILARTDEFNPKRAELIGELHQGARDLGFSDYVAMWNELGQLDLPVLAEQMQRLLQRTQDAYFAELDSWLASVGVSRAEANTSDTARLFRAPGLDPLFPVDKLVASLRCTMAGMGIDMDRQPNLHLDIEARPLKSPRAFCCPIRVPDEVILVIMPAGGRHDYESIMHESGHAEHFANTAADLPFAFKYLGDNSVTEGYAMLIEYLEYNRKWLTEVLGIADPREHLRLAHFHKVFMLRRYASKLLYEMQMHRSDLTGMERVYADTLGKNLGLAVAPENYLSDVDRSFYAARYLRAWIFEMQLRRSLEERFGEDWFAKPEAGTFLLSLWSEGQSRTADELARQLGYSGLDPEPLIHELESRSA